MKKNKKGCMDEEFIAGVVIGLMFALFIGALLINLSENQTLFDNCEYKYDDCEVFKCQADHSNIDNANYHLREYEICIIKENFLDNDIK